MNFNPLKLKRAMNIVFNLELPEDEHWTRNDELAFKHYTGRKTMPLSELDLPPVLLEVYDTEDTSTNDTNVEEDIGSEDTDTPSETDADDVVESVEEVDVEEDATEEVVKVAPQEPAQGNASKKSKSRK